VIYPKNIFTKDPASGSIRPFIIFVAYEMEFNIAKAKSWEDAIHTYIPRGGFVLPFPDGGMIDTQVNEYSQENPLASKLTNVYKNAFGGIPAEGLAYLGGVVPDPALTQIYRGSKPRLWSGTWQIIPQSLGEAALAFLLLKNLKMYASPDSIPLFKKFGMLKQPYVFDLFFSNPIIHLSMSFNKMVIESYSINYFAQDYPSTYKDMMPKHISLTINMAEYGLKYRSDWSLTGGII